MPRNAKFSLLLGLGVLAALSGGAALCWRLWPAPQPVMSRVIEGPRKPASLAVADAQKGQPLPYDLKAMQNPSALELAQFEAWLMTASCDEVMRLVAGLESSAGFGVGDPAARLMLRRFADFSAGERLRTLQKHIPAPFKGNDYFVKQAVTELGKDVLPVDKEEIAELMKRFSDIGDYDILLMVHAAWVKEDFDGAKAFVESMVKKGGEGLGYLYGMLAREDLRVTRERALALPPGDEKSAALIAVAGVMAQTDFAGALRWLHQQGLTGGDDGIVIAAAHRDPIAAAAAVLENPGLFENQRGPRRVEELFKTWAEKDLSAAQAWLAANPLPEKLQEQAENALAWEEFDQLPLDAALTAWQAWPEERRHATVYEMAKRLAVEDPAHVLDRLAELLPEDQQARNMGEILHGLPQEDRGQILRWLPRLVDFFRDNANDMSMLNALPTEDVQAAMEKLSDADRKTMQTALAEQALGYGLDGNVEKALALLPEIDPHAKDPFLYSRIAVGLAHTDPARAAAWVADFPEGSSKEWAARNLVATWAKYDPDAAAAWVGQLPAGASRDRSSIEVAYLQGLAGDYQSALRVADGVGDESQRGVAVGSALQSLWRRDQAAAEQALAAVSLSPDRRERVRDRLRQGEYQR